MANRTPSDEEIRRILGHDLIYDKHGRPLGKAVKQPTQKQPAQPNIKMHDESGDGSKD